MLKRGGGVTKEMKVEKRKGGRGKGEEERVASQVSPVDFTTNIRHVRPSLV